MSHKRKVGLAMPHNRERYTGYHTPTKQPEMQPLVEGKKLSGAQKKAQHAKPGMPGAAHTGGRGKVRKQHA